MASESRILQIIPAQGWFALIRNAESEEEDLTPLACFALFESRDEGETVHMVRPMGWGDGVMQFCDELDGFVGLMHSGSSEG